jgi:hypothetical protein
MFGMQADDEEGVMVEHASTIFHVPTIEPPQGVKVTQSPDRLVPSDVSPQPINPTDAQTNATKTEVRTAVECIADRPLWIPRGT